MLNGKLRISPDMPKAWKKLHYTILRNAQKLSATTIVDSVEIVNETNAASVTAEIWSQEYTFTDSVSLKRSQ